MDFSQFKKDREEALLSLDESKIRAYAAKYGSAMPAGPEVFWSVVHKAITACTDFPLENRLASKQWLAERNLKSMDDGDLS